MDQKDINKIQNKVTNLLNSKDGDSLKVLSQDCCSEVARLVGSWIKKSQKSDKIAILKGDHLAKDNISHDVLAIFENTKITIIDLTVWQFFPDKSILVGEYVSLEKVYAELNKIYGGQWKISEKLENVINLQEEKWKKIIKKNIAENKTEF